MDQPGDLASYQRLANHAPAENYGQVLYYKGKAQQHSLERKRQMEREVQVKKEMAEATFRPSIGESTNLKTGRQKGVKPEDFLLFQGRLAEEKKQKLKKDIEKQEMESASFKPKILKKSEQIVRRRNERVFAENVSDNSAPTRDVNTRSNELYNDAFVRKQKLERRRNEPAHTECTFKPSLVTKSRNKDGNKSFITATDGNDLGNTDINRPIKEVDESREITTGSNVFERLTIDAQIQPEKRKGREQVELERSKVDEKTGQLLFRPMTGRGVQGRDNEVKSVGGVSNYLYKKHVLKEQAQRTQKEL